MHLTSTKFFLTITLFSLLLNFTFAQDKGNGKVSGRVIDSSTNEPIEFATIALRSATEDKILDGTVCDDKGKFSLNKIADGEYKVDISFIGFESKSIPVTISSANNNHDLGTLQLTTKAEILGEVTVEAEKVLIEERVDRTIYNAENDATTRGGDATDVLKRVPLLSVDMDGNLSMRGNSNVRVLINNKPSAITASSVSDALKMIPAEDIKSVEVITSPSAKYDAEGSAGIINIITKKNVLEGATLMVNTSAGLRGSHLGMNGAYRKGKVGMTLGGWGRLGYNVQGSYANRQTTGDIVNVQEAETSNDYLMGNYTYGIDYDINKNNFINSSIRIGARNFNSYQNNLLTNSYENGSIVNSTLRDVDIKNESENIDLNIGYTRLFEKPQKEFSIQALYTKNNRVNNFINSDLDENSYNILNRIKNINDSYNEETTIQIDYQTPIGKEQIIEFGGKEILRKVSSDYTYLEAAGSDGPYEPSENENLTNVFDYQQNITAGYLSYTLGFLETYTLKTGVRYEHTIIDADFATEIETDIPDYDVFVPSINISKKLKKGNMIKAAYTRRISRPSIEFLNPNLQAQNILSPTKGNPNLAPEYTNNYELSYSYYVKGSAINISGFVRNTNDAIQSVREAEGQAILTTYKNIGREDAYGVNLFVSMNTGKLSLNGGADIYYSVLQNNDPNPDFTAKNEGWTAGYRLFGSYNIKNGWGVQAFGFLRARQIQLQGTQAGFGFYTLSFKKDFAEKRGSIGFGAENFLSSTFTMKNRIESNGIIQENNVVIRNMSFKVDFSYRIGKLGQDANAGRRSRKRISNDDLKDGGSGDMSGGGDAPQVGGGNQRRPPQPSKTSKKDEKNSMQSTPQQKPAENPNGSTAKPQDTKE